jgi:hypothetical protein
MEARTSSGVSRFNFGYFDDKNGAFLQSTANLAGGTVWFNCADIDSNGGNDQAGKPEACYRAAVSVTTRRPILSIKLASTVSGLINRSQIKDIEVAVLAKTNDSLIELIVGGTLTGASFATVGGNSVVEYDTAATAITGGLPAAKMFYAVAGAGSSAASTGTDVDIFQPLSLVNVDGVAIDNPILSVVATSLNGTSSCSSIMNYHSITT